jgi:hypothetical protein
MRRQSKKLQIQGAQILRNEAYLQYVAVTKDAVQRRSWTFCEVVNFEWIRIVRRFIVFMLCVLGFAASHVGRARAGETGHYVNGVEGIKAATLPPPGFYWRIYNVYYGADELRDKDGDKLDVGFDLSVFALVNRFVWISDIQLLGGDFGADVIIPLIYTDIEIDALGIEDDAFGLGDIAVEPFVLAWHGARYDASCGLAAYLPTGAHDEDEPASPGKDFWTAMMTLGGTVYFDAAKTWSASILARYEIHSEKKDADVRPGDDFHFEWGIGKSLARIWDVGLSGYCQWQVTDDRGSDVYWDKGVHDEVCAIGPEVDVFVPPIRLLASLRTLWEFAAKDRSEGHVISLTLTKIF